MQRTCLCLSNVIVFADSLVSPRVPPLVISPLHLSFQVVSCRGLPDAAVEADLLDACGQFGAISYIQITGRGNALLEFEVRFSRFTRSFNVFREIERSFQGARSAEECVNYNQTTDIFVLQTAVYFSFAPMDEIPRRG